MSCFHVKSWKDYLKGAASGLLFAIITLSFTFASAARSIKVSEFTFIHWVFIIVGGLVVILQIVPAFLLFLSFITAVYKRKNTQEITVTEAQAEAIEAIVHPKETVK